MSDLLAVEGLRAGYGASTILNDVSLRVDAGTSLALLGRNGVGKSTLLMTIMGLTQRHAGRIWWQRQAIERLPVHKRALSGLAWVPQERGMFPSLTVAEHLTVVARPGHWNLERVYELFPRLRERKANMGNQLSGGEQQMLALGRALMTNPRLLMLDEPMEGLAPVIVQEIARVIRRLVAETGLGLVIVEQHAKLALSLSQRAIVLDRGTVVYDGGSEPLLHDPAALHKLIAVS